MKHLSLSLRLAALVALLLVEAGCASEADLDYTPAKLQDNSQKPDQSYHGWTGTPD
jgi:hypothetical protein